MGEKRFEAEGAAGRSTAPSIFDVIDFCKVFESVFRLAEDNLGNEMNFALTGTV